MEQNKPEYHVVSLSGGKDSTAMLLMMLEKGMPVDDILFCDTGLEFPGLYAHLDKVEQYIGRPITRIQAPHSFEYYFCQHPIRRKRSTTFAEKYGADHLGYGWAGPKMRWCTERLKNEPRERYLRKLRETYTVIEYVGLPQMRDTAWNARIIKIQTTGIRLWTGTSPKRNAFGIVMTTALIGMGCMKYSAGCPAGAAHCSRFRSCESCTGTFLNCGNS